MYLQNAGQKSKHLEAGRSPLCVCVCVCVCACPAESVSSSATCVLPHACQECGRFVMALPVSLSGEQGGFSSWASLSN